MAESVDTLIPPIKRAIDGPTASVSALTDEQARDLAADAIGEVILLTGGLFEHQLLVIARDPTYGAPTEWEIDPALEEFEKAVIVNQAALNFFFHKLRDVKVAETIRDEGAEHSYQLSSSLIRDQMKYLADARDRALEAIQARTPVPIAYLSFLAQRDAQVAALVEPAWPSWP